MFFSLAGFIFDVLLVLIKTAKTMNHSDILIIKKEVDKLFDELDDLNYQNDIVVRQKLYTWDTMRTIIQSEKIGALKLLQRLERKIK